MAHFKDSKLVNSTKNPTKKQFKKLVSEVRKLSGKNFKLKYDLQESISLIGVMTLGLSKLRSDASYNKRIIRGLRKTAKQFNKESKKALRNKNAELKAVKAELEDVKNKLDMVGAVEKLYQEEDKVVKEVQQ